MVVVILSLVVGVAVGVVVAVVVARRQRLDATAVIAELRRQVGDERDALRHDATAERDAAVRAAVEQLALLNRETLGAQVDAGRATLETRKELIDAELEAMRGELGKVTELVASLEKARERNYGALEQQLADTARTTQELGRTTQALREALASSKARGQWGERMAEDVLRLAGFVENVNYRKQKAVDGGRAIPDFTFDLPKGHVLHMDAKFPLRAYVRFLEASSDNDRAAARSEFLRDVRQRVRELTTRDYVDAGRRTVDYVLLFIPNESVYSFIHEHDCSLLEDALQQKVVFCSPLTLFALLAVIRQAFDNFMIEQTSDEILRLLGAFTLQWQKFGAAVDTVGKRLDSAQKAYDELSTTRRRALERPLAKIDDLRRQRGLAADPLLSPGADVVELDELRSGDASA